MNLEACLVQDAAHMTRGAAGNHVAKVQFALLMLDGLEIDLAETAAKIYGRATAAAVLAYKNKRRIINYSYQTQADDIVGKMTIASLDREVRLRECQRLHACCGDPVRSGATAGTFGLSEVTAPALVSGPVAEESFTRTLNVYWSITRAALRAGRDHLKYADKAGDLVSRFGMNIALTPGGPYQDVVPNDDIVDPRYNTDTLRIRKASEDRRPGLPNVLRVISCPFVPGTEYAVTDSGTVGRRTFPPS
jgi:hypothetical protein